MHILISVALLILAILMQWCWNKLDQKDENDDVDFRKIIESETPKTTADSSPTTPRRSVATSDSDLNADEEAAEVNNF